MTKVTKCIVCHKALEEVQAKPDSFYPYGGLEFITRGHYGSTVFDPMDGSVLRVCICDKCVVEGINENRIIGSGRNNT